jgi:hypothetical protein
MQPANGPRCTKSRGCKLVTQHTVAVRNLAIGLQIHEAQARPAVIREPLAFRATHVDGLGLFHRHRGTLVVTPLRPTGPAVWVLPWTSQYVRLVA